MRSINHSLTNTLTHSSLTLAHTLTLTHHVEKSRRELHFSADIVIESGDESDDDEFTLNAPSPAVSFHEDDVEGRRLSLTAPDGIGPLKSQSSASYEDIDGVIADGEGVYEVRDVSLFDLSDSLASWDGGRLISLI